MRVFLFAFVTAWAMLAPGWSAAEESICHGTVSRGRLEHGAKLPLEGKNFSAYSTVGAAIGRTYVHGKVRDTVVAAYKSLESSAPQKVFVYGETGWEQGGQIRPHRTHQNGLSIDFMVPVVDSSGKSLRLPTSADNSFGYGIDFDKQGRFGELRIDFDALADHLYELATAAKRKGIGIALVIFEPSYLPMLWKTRRGPYLQKNLPFMKGRAWIRHDEHYHVDFAVPCKPYKE